MASLCVNIWLPEEGFVYLQGKIKVMIKNKNTTIDKIALSEFDTHYDLLGKNEKQWCHDEMVNNPKWLAPKWKTLTKLGI